MKRAKRGDGDKPKKNKSRVCPLCKKTQTVLSRHLQVHVKRGEIAAHRIPALVQVVDHGDKRYIQEEYVGQKATVTSQRRRLLKCPICELLTPYMTKHLQQKHKLASDHGDYFYWNNRAFRTRENGR